MLVEAPRFGFSITATNSSPPLLLPILLLLLLPRLLHC